jgi:hypothetical protein
VWGRAGVFKFGYAFGVSETQGGPGNAPLE